ncbi:MAG: ABC transporter ATP-binding protein [Aquificaceae bacterium]
MIEVVDLHIKVKNFSLENISLKVETGSCHCLIGPTGCGKTTLLETILGLRKVQKGRILLDGKDITYLPLHKRGFSYVPQDLALFPHLTVEENILYGIKHGDVPNKKEREEEALRLVHLLGIAHLLKRKVDALSGGERQRVALARALASGHKYLLLDEPLSALHEGMKKELWFLLKELQEKYEFTILMVTHDIEEAFFLADHVSVMIGGTIHQSDRKEVVYRYPSNLEVAKFFGIKNIFTGGIQGKEGSHFRIYCKELNGEVLLPVESMNNLPEDRSIAFGIRSEDIMILRQDLPFRQENIIPGIIKEVYTAGPSSIVVFSPEGSEKLMEIKLPDYAFSKLSLKPSMSAIITLRSERLFVLKK